MALTKIIATVGPAIYDENILIQLIKAGVDVFRFNLKHNNSQWHYNCVKKVKRAQKITGKPVALLFDFPDDAKENFYKDYFLIAQKEEIDFWAISFVRSKSDIEIIKKRVKRFNLSAKILSKIEDQNALNNFDEILSFSDGIMVARGDLGKEIPFEQVPYYQKMIIKKCVEVGKPVIVATQMLQSMVNNPFPTRAEVSDVANSILDYTDAVMLSEETAIGKYPLKAVSVMERICRFWEMKRPAISNVNFRFDHQTAAMCYSAYQLFMSPFYQRENIKAFVILTHNGMTAHMISRLRPFIPILALTPDKKLKDRLSILYGVVPILFKEFAKNNKNDEESFYRKRNASDIKKILNLAKSTRQIKKGDRVILLYAEDWGVLGKTNILRIQEVP